MNHSPSTRPHPLIIAHRGASAEAPENTLAAFRRALEVGASMVECDVHLSRDGVPVIMHDSTVDRTTDGRGPVGSFSAKELAALDAGGWKAARYAGEPVPTLHQLLRLILGRARIAVELKDEACVAAVADTVDSVGIDPADVNYFSFSSVAIGALSERAPAFPSTLLVEDLDSVPPHLPEADRNAQAVARAKQAGATCLGPCVRICTAELVTTAHASGLDVLVWTVNDRAMMERALSWGADGVITDHPALGLELLSPTDGSAGS